MTGRRTPFTGGLTASKLLAGAGAAATSAVVGSLFGANGTVAGAAIGSVASTVSTAVYERSIDRTRESVAARILPLRRRAPARPTLALVPAARAGASPTTARHRAGGRRNGTGHDSGLRGGWVRWTVAAVVVFAAGLLPVTGVELVKGSTVTRGESGTSVGRVLRSAPADEETPVASSPAVRPPTTSARPAGEPQEPSATAVPPTTRTATGAPASTTTSDGSRAPRTREPVPPPSRGRPGPTDLPRPSPPPVSRGDVPDEPSR